jgi:DNA-binding NarL/FixJ family response regulator
MDSPGYVLIVDDDPDARFLLSKVISSLGLRTEIAGSGVEAISAIEREIPRLILLDLMMPQMNGFEVLYWLRSSPSTSGVPVIIVSAYVGGQDLPELSGLSVVEKSRFRPTSMIDVVQNLIGSQGEADEAPVAGHSFRPVPGDAGDTVIRTALVDLLSARELDVLRLIADGLSNQEIADEILVSLNTVKTHVKTIFSKLNVGSRTQAIAHARAMGLIK